MKIKTNNKPRLLLYWYQLTPKEQAEFDYLEDPECGSFFRYKGHTYDLGEASRCCPDGDFKGWEGNYPETYFSGVLVKIPPEDSDRIIVGRYSN